MFSNSVIINCDTPWVVSGYKNEAVKKAVQDVKRDWYKVFGYQPIVLDAVPDSWDGVLLLLGIRDGFKKDLNIEFSFEKESFEISEHQLSNNQTVILAGGDDIRGAIYAVYTFSEELLGVDPLYYWTDNEPVKRKEIAISLGLKKKYGPPTFKYRGWFINDEDLLEGHHHDPLEENIISIEMWDKIFETLLRLKGNVIVPGTFTFPDETCRVLASKRGLIINDHHVAPLGLVTFDWPEDIEYSYIKNRDFFEKMWKECVDAQKDKEVVWTVSFRGKNDGPFWEWDQSAPTSEVERANIINHAIQKQAELVREAQPEADIIFNMYHEQTEYFKKGLLKIPERVICVWPDDGAGVISDNGQVMQGDGLYYHIIGAARNRLTEGVSPERIYKEIGRFVKKGATSFCITNVSNIRNVVLGCDTVMRFIWQSEPYLENAPAKACMKTIENWSERQFGSSIAKEISSLYLSFYKSTNLRQPESSKPPQDAYALGWPVGLWNSQFNQVLPDFRLNLFTQAAAKKFIKIIDKKENFDEEFIRILNDYNKVLEEPEANLSNLSVMAHSLKERIPENRRDFYQAHILTQIDVLNYLNEALRKFIEAIMQYYNGEQEKSVVITKDSLSDIETVIESLHKAEHGKWSAWFMNERFSCFWHTRDLLRVVYAKLQGKKVQFYREYCGWDILWPDIYKYHKKSSENYPLFYKRQ